MLRCVCLSVCLSVLSCVQSFTQQAMVLPAGSVLDANSSLKFANK